VIRLSRMHGENEPALGVSEIRMRPAGQSK
jgi:hypothetical protein